MVYYNLYITGSYNPIYNPTNHGIFSLLKCFPCRPNTCWECLFGISFWGSTCFLARCSGICLRWCLTFYHGLTPPFGEYFFPTTEQANLSQVDFLGETNFFPHRNWLQIWSRKPTAHIHDLPWNRISPQAESSDPFFSRRRHYAPRFYTSLC